tara:strand:+ start:426 stop:605 length:180 start_codon:yes stop_codon:yes gene_type:complete
MLNTIENRFKKTFARAGLLTIGTGLYIGSTTLAVFGFVIVGIYALDQYVEWKDDQEAIQ